MRALREVEDARRLFEVADVGLLVGADLILDLDLAGAPRLRLLAELVRREKAVGPVVVQLPSIGFPQLPDVLVESQLPVDRKAGFVPAGSLEWFEFARIFSGRFQNEGDIVLE